MTDQIQERRQFQRIPVVFIATYKVHEPVDLRMFIQEEEILTSMLDLSEGGMAIQTTYDIPAASILLIEFTFLDTTAPKDAPLHKIKILGEVRYNVLKDDDVRRLGIRFIEISENDKYVISVFCRKALGK